MDLSTHSLHLALNQLPQIVYRSYDCEELEFLVPFPSCPIPIYHSFPSDSIPSQVTHSTINGFCHIHRKGSNRQLMCITRNLICTERRLGTNRQNFEGCGFWNRWRIRSRTGCFWGLWRSDFNSVLWSWDNRKTDSLNHFLSRESVALLRNWSTLNILKILQICTFHICMDIGVNRVLKSSVRYFHKNTIIRKKPVELHLRWRAKVTCW